MTGYFWAQARRNAIGHLSPAQRAAIARAQAMQTLARLKDYDESQHPRDEDGKWTDGGGGSVSGGKQTKPPEGAKHPGKGYSKHAWVDDKGVIHTSNVYDAQRALFEDRKVELNQVKQISTLVKRLGETAAEMAEQGENAPVFNLCNVSVKGTNLFCADQIGIPRAEMPVIPAKRTKDFIKHLKKLGYEVEKGKERAENLRASQSEIDGSKVAIQMERIRSDGFYKRLVISKDDYILDGHHTWAGELGLDAQDNNLSNDKEVKIARVNIGIVKLIEIADAWTKDQGIAKKPAGQKAYDESQHPRNEHGEWTDSGDSGGAASEKPADDKSAPEVWAGKGPALFKIAGVHLDGVPHMIEAGADTKTKEHADELVSHFPKSTRIYAGNLSGADNGAGGFVKLRVDLTPNKNTGQVNETGIKRYKAFVKAIEKNGHVLRYDRSNWMESQSYGSLDELHDAIGVPKKSNNKAWQAAKAEALQTLAQLRAYDESQHPRDETGKWTDSGGGGDGAGGAAASDKDKPASVDHLIEPHVVDVGGDKWNQITAYNLERDYQTARPAIEHLEQKAIGAVEDTSGDDGEEDDHSDYVPEEWDAMSEAAQEQAGEEYESKYYDEYLQSEQDNWSTEYAPDEARVKVAEDFNEGNASDDIEWAQDALADVRAERDDSGKPPIPFTEKQLIDAIHIDYEDQSASWPKKDVEINFDDGLLTKPAGYDPAQATLPGIEKIEPHEMLTEDMRTEIAVALTKAFEKRADDVANDLEPPDYLADQAKEQVKEGWDSMSDSDKFAWTESNTSILSTDKGGGQEDSSIVASLDNAKLDRLPTKYDPLNDTSGDDYRRTQILARYLSRERTKEIMAARDIEAPTDKDLREADNELWKSWKESSTSEDGKLIQLATAEELGGRLNSHTRAAIEPAKAKARADRIFPFIGGYDGVKALIRAKWEVTQYLLDKADKDELELYRGMTLDKMLVEKIFKHAESGKRVGSFTHLPTMDVKRNGAASTTTALTVANGWGGGGAGKVTLRAIVPRTAAVSIPAYGINIKSEQEVVVAGTAWKGWDVWQGQAPGFTSTPLQKHV